MINSGQRKHQGVTDVQPPRSLRFGSLPHCPPLGLRVSPPRVESLQPDTRPYTPYHLVAVYDSADELVFHEIGLEHAFALDVDEARQSFVVTTRSGRWSYGHSSGAEGQATSSKTPPPLQN